MKLGTLLSITIDKHHSCSVKHYITNTLKLQQSCYNEYTKLNWAYSISTTINSNHMIKTQLESQDQVLHLILYILSTILSLSSSTLQTLNIYIFIKAPKPLQ